MPSVPTKQVQAKQVKQTRFSMTKLMLSDLGKKCGACGLK